MSQTSTASPPANPSGSDPVPQSPVRGAGRRRWRALPWTALALLSLAVAGYAVGQYATASLATMSANQNVMAANYADRALWLQVAFYAHISMGGLALLVGPLQFLKPLRDRAPRIHRMVGYGYVTSIAVSSVSGLIIAFINKAGLVGTFGFGTLALLWAWTTYRGLRAAMVGDLASHKAWMIRSFALTFAAVTLRLELGTLVGAQIASGATGAAQIFANAYAVVPFLCWLPNLVVAELMIRRRNLPGLRYTTGPVTPPTRRRISLDAR